MSNATKGRDIKYYGLSSLCLHNFPNLSDYQWKKWSDRTFLGEFMVGLKDHCFL